MAKKIRIKVFANYPLQMMYHSHKGRGGHADIVRNICEKHGLKFSFRHERLCGDTLMVVSDGGNESSLGKALVEIMETGVSLALTY